MSDVSRAPTVICQNGLHSPSLSYILYLLLFLASIFLPAIYYFEIALILISFYSMVPVTIFPHSLFSSIVFVSHLSSTTSYLNSCYFPPTQISVCVLKNSTSLSPSHPLLLSDTTYVTAGHLVDLAFIPHPLTSILIHFPKVNHWVRPLLCVCLCRKGGEIALAGIGEISVFCRERPYTPKAPHCISKQAEATQ